MKRQTMTKRTTKVESSTEMVEVKSDRGLMLPAEKPTNIEISVDYVAAPDSFEDSEKTRQSKDVGAAAAAFTDDNEEVFTTPSVIPQDYSRLTISDKELDTARKRLRKSVADSIFKIKHLPETPCMTMSLPRLSTGRLSTYLEFPPNKQKAKAKHSVAFLLT